MANKEQLEILKKGVEGWNKWREENRDITTIDLQKILLDAEDLGGINFIRADLRWAGIRYTDLHEANLHEEHGAGRHGIWGRSSSQ